MITLPWWEAALLWCASSVAMSFVIHAVRCPKTKDQKDDDDAEQITVLLTADVSGFVAGMNAVGRAIQRKDP